MSEITELLRAVQAGDHASLDAVFERVYAELRTLAAARLASQPGESTLSATALVHESYLKLSDASQLSLTDRKHFFACAARAMRQTRISEIVRGKRSITIETALRLSKALGVDDRFWINIQTDYDLEIERDRHGAELDKVTSLVAS